MSTHRCPRCRWQGTVRIYNLVWSREWACPRCLHLVVEDAGEAA